MRNDNYDRYSLKDFSTLRERINPNGVSRANLERVTRKARAARVVFDMNINPGQDLLPTFRVGLRYPRSRYLGRRLTSFSRVPRDQGFPPIEERHNFDPGVHSNQHVGSLSSSVVTEERNRMAGEIHDTLAQQFAGILLHLEAANSSFKTAQPNAFECLAHARELAKCGLEDVRRILLGLRPKPLEGARLSDALKQLAGRFSRDCGVQCVFSMNGRAHSLPEEAENELYRVTQEALCNVRKHSRAAYVSILLSYKVDAVALRIKDNGQGFDVARHQAGVYGFGLQTMRDRARNLGGRMDINTAAGRGTELRLCVPLSGKTSKKRNGQ